MNEKAQEDEFEEDDDGDDEIVDGGENIDVDILFRDLDKRKRSGTKVTDPAWRKLERYREDRQTAELVSDFDDYEIGDDGPHPAGRQGAHRPRHRRAS